MQGKFTDECFQCQMPEEEEEPLQGKFAAGLTGTLQAREEAPPNKTGMPDHLKSGLGNGWKQVSAASTDSTVTCKF